MTRSIATIHIIITRSRGTALDSLDYEFFEEYKRLDRLCADMYNSRQGISTYIEKMEENFAQGEQQIDSWRQDYNLLKHLRWIRNKIAHEYDCAGYAGENDLEDIAELYHRFLNMQDPLTLLRRISQRKIKQEKVFVSDDAQSISAKGFLSAGVAFIAFILLLTFFFQ